jgi:hypothetical protein
MISLFSSVAILLIALCQCFHVFKLYKQLIAMEVVLNALVRQFEMNDLIKQQSVKKEIKKSPLFSRTAEQKRVASIKRKEWWERKRAEDAKKATQPID